MLKHWLLPPMLLLLALSVMACNGGGSDNGATSQPAATTSDGPTAQPTENPDTAPSIPVTMFQGQDVVGGEQIELSSLLGDKPIVLNFWAGLCPPCRAEMPDFQIFYNEFKDRVVVIGVDVGQFTGLGSREDATTLLSELRVSYPAGYTEDPEVLAKFRVLGIPATVFIDGDGEIFYYWSGALNEEALREKTLEMLEG